MATTTTKRTPSGAAEGTMQRITSSPVDAAISTTVRVPTEVIGLGPFLLIEGDSEGALSFQQITQDGYLKLQGTY